MLLKQTLDKRQVMLLCFYADEHIDILFYLRWILFCFIIVLGASHLWPTKQAYITQLAKIHSTNTKTVFNNTLNLFWGIFFGIYYTCMW